MTMIIWRVLCIISMVLLLAAIVALFVLRLMKNKYYREFKEDELMKTEKTTNSLNSIFFTSGETKKYIKKYVVCKTLYDQYLVCNFAKRYREIIYYIVEYNAKKKVTCVKRVCESYTSDTSKVIALEKRCKYVNVIIGSVDEVEINTDVIRPLSLSKIRLYALLKSLIVFFGLFVVRHFLVEILGGTYAKTFLCYPLNYIAVGVSFALGLLSYFITVLSFRKKNVKALNGGALEYEFV